VSWTCSRCGSEHEGLPLDWAFDQPLHWNGGNSSDDWISEDLCVWTDDAGEPAFFIRGVLPIAVVDSGETLGYGVWSSLSAASFKRVYELWDDPARVEEDPYFGWLSNSLPGYPETLGLSLDVVTEALDKRPTLRLHHSHHPLVREQEEGITSERVLEVAALNFHGER
jgi:hypothetical protein